MFDASKYLTKLPKRYKDANGQWRTRYTDYLEVKWRLAWLREDKPDAVIETELVRLENDLAVFKASVSIPGGGSATGWGTETADDFGDYIEKAETKALGRALAALGYGTQFCTDFDEAVRNGEKRVVDAPVGRRIETEQGDPGARRAVPTRLPDRQAGRQASVRVTGPTLLDSLKSELQRCRKEVWHDTAEELAWFQTHFPGALVTRYTGETGVSFAVLNRAAQAALLEELRHTHPAQEGDTAEGVTDEPSDAEEALVGET